MASFRRSSGSFSGQSAFFDLGFHPVQNLSADIGAEVIGNYNQATPNNAAGTVPLQSRRPIPEFSDITYVFNGGKSRYDAFQAKYEWRLRADMSVLTSLTLSKAKDNGAQSLENQNGNFPGPQDFYNLEAEYGTGAYDQPYNTTTSFVWSLPFGHDQRWGSNVSALTNALIGGWQLAGVNRINAGEMVTLTYTPGATMVVSGIAQDFRGANNYRANVSCDPYAQGSAQTITNWFDRASSSPNVMTSPVPAMITAARSGASRAIAPGYIRTLLR